MDGWQGFSDADLLRIKQERQESTGMKPSPGKPTTVGKSHVSSPRNASRQQQRRPLNTQSANDLPANQRLSWKPATSQPTVTSQSDRLSTRSQSTASAGATSLQCHDGGDDGKSKSSTAVTTGLTDTGPVGQQQVEHREQPPEEKELGDDEGVSRELGNLEQFQQRQKQMEELNKQKRKILSTTIAQRRKAAKAESTRLNHIQTELNKIDHLLIVDVSIIRDKIEEASRAYLAAQRRYEHAEHELIEAKLELHSASDLKEQLTEHLYTVINENETRKARKLAELMGQLEVPLKETEEKEVPSNVHMPHLIPVDTAITVKSPTHATPLKETETSTDQLNTDNCDKPSVAIEVQSPTHTATKETEQSTDRANTDKCDKASVNGNVENQKKVVTVAEGVKETQVLEKTDTANELALKPA